MFYLQETLNDFLNDFDVKVDIIEESGYEYKNEYFIVIKINNKVYDFLIYESINSYEVPCKLIMHNGNNYYIGAIKIFNKIIDLIHYDLLIHEINEIEKELIIQENEINQVDFQIKGAANIINKFSLPVDIALLCF